MALLASMKLLCWAQLVLGLVTVFGRANYLGMQPAQLPTLSGMGNEYWPKCGDALWLGVIASIAHSLCGCTCGWQVKLCNPSSTHAIPQCRRVSC